MVDSIVLASTYRLNAENFWESAKKLDMTLDKRSDGSPSKLTAIPFYFLISHAVELFLKSALLKRGFTENDVKKYDYRHNLDALLAALQKKGVNISPETATMINGLSVLHKTHALRYDVLLEGGKKFWAPTHLLLQMHDELLLLTRISTLSESRKVRK